MGPEPREQTGLLSNSTGGEGLKEKPGIGLLRQGNDVFP